MAGRESGEVSLLQDDTDLGLLLQSLRIYGVCPLWVYPFYVPGLVTMITENVCVWGGIKFIRDIEVFFICFFTSAYLGLDLRI